MEMRLSDPNLTHSDLFHQIYIVFFVAVCFFLVPPMRRAFAPNLCSPTLMWKVEQSADNKRRRGVGRMLIKCVRFIVLWEGSSPARGHKKKQKKTKHVKNAAFIGLSRETKAEPSPRQRWRPSLRRSFKDSSESS